MINEAGNLLADLLVARRSIDRQRRGAAIDDVEPTALGSLTMSRPPTSLLTTIAVPAPQADSTDTNSGAFNGFYPTARPLRPKATLKWQETM